MYELDREKFGAFVAQLRKEKGYTQKELAQQLHLSNQAVSKWETGVSIPDTAMLIPLAQALDVTVTELLVCGRQESRETMDPGAVEEVVQTAIRYSGQKPNRAWRNPGFWAWAYGISLALSAAGVGVNRVLGTMGESLLTLVVLGAVFGAYFCFFARRGLPDYYDRERINLVSDGFFRMNVPGLYFNNHNWPYILNVGKIWSCSVMGISPLIWLILYKFSPRLCRWIVLPVLLGLFVPLLWVGKRYEKGAGER